MSAIKIVDNVYEVGVKDPDLKVFDITMKTDGTTYNSYLIKGTDKIALIDTVKEEFRDEFFENLEEIVPIDKIDYLIVNHNEPDHSGAMPYLLDKNPNIKIYCSAAAVPYVKAIINRDADINGVKDKTTLELGGKTLEFITMPYMHWPDTMMDFLHEDGILFSNDGFAAHLCSEELYADQLSADVDYEVDYYFQCIMRPFTGYIRRNMKKLDDYDIKMVAPSHGPIFRNNPTEYIEKYKEWSADKAEGQNIISIFYASNYGNTYRIAEKLADLLKEKDYTVVLTDATNCDHDEVRDQLESSKAIIIGTPTFNGDAVKPIWDLTHLFSTVYMLGKKAAVFGSYGWGGEGAKLVSARMSGLRMKVMEEEFRARLIPSDEELTELKQFADNFSEYVG